MKCTFSFDHYKYILETALNNDYLFVSFDTFKKKFQKFKDKKICILRHDIDYSPDKMLNFSNIEYKLGIKSTYFIQNTSYVYNLSNFDNLRFVREIVSQGHKLALHFDPLIFNFNFNELNKYILLEKKKLKDNTNSYIENIISFHNPHQYSKLILNKKINKITHTYEPIYFSKIKYISDSQGWYEDCPCKIFKTRRYNHIQLLTHPYLWSEKPRKDFSEDIAELIFTKSKNYLDYVIENHPIAKKNVKKIKIKLKNNFKKL